MPGLHFETVVKRSPETVFQLLSDLAGYGAWLPSSRLYSQTTAISEQPIRAGTTYLDKGPTSEMRGEVTACEPFSRLVFRQSSSFNQPWLKGELDVRIRYTFHPKGEGTQVIRECRVRTTSSTLTVLRPLLMQAIRGESKRIMQRMKWYLEAR